MVRKGPPHVIVFPAAGPDQPLKLRDDPLPASVSGIVHAKAVVHFLPSVQTEHHVAHLAVGKVDDIIVDQHAVGRQGEAEVLAGLLLALTRVGDQLLHRIKIHQRLTAEEIDLQVSPGAGMRDQKIQRLSADLRAHDGAFAVIPALAGKAVAAVQIAGVRHVQAERLDDIAAFLFKASGHRLKAVRRKELACVLQCRDLVIAGVGLALRQALHAIFRQHLRRDLFPAFRLVKGNHVIGEPVHQMDGARAHVQHDVISVQLILMNHSDPPRFKKNAAFRRHSFF